MASNNKFVAIAARFLYGHILVAATALPAVASDPPGPPSAPSPHSVPYPDPSPDANTGDDDPSSPPRQFWSHVLHLLSQPGAYVSHADVEREFNVQMAASPASGQDQVIYGANFGPEGRIEVGLHASRAKSTAWFDMRWNMAALSGNPNVCINGARAAKEVLALGWKLEGRTRMYMAFDTYSRNGHPLRLTYGGNCLIGVAFEGSQH